MVTGDIQRSKKFKVKSKKEAQNAYLNGRYRLGLEFVCFLLSRLAMPKALFSARTGEPSAFLFSLFSLLFSIFTTYACKKYRGS